MKKTYKMCVVSVMVGFIACQWMPAMAAPTAATCQQTFSSIESNCMEYEISSIEMSSDKTLYICTCAQCPSGYHIEGAHSVYKDYDGYAFFLPNGCAVGSGSGGSGSNSCSTGSLCTICKGPSVKVNGQIYCGMWADTKAVKTCSGSPGSNVSYVMSQCCDSDGYAVGGSSGCYVMSCKSGFTSNDDRTACVCAVGYYGTTSSCTRCPAEGGVYGFTAGIGTSSITDCYIPAGVTISDSIGEYQYGEDCYYTK